MIKLRTPLGLQESSRLSSSMRVPLKGKEARKDIESYPEPTIGVQSHDTVHMLSTSLLLLPLLQGTLRPKQPLQESVQGRSVEKTGRRLGKEKVCANVVSGRKEDHPMQSIHQIVFTPGFARLITRSYCFEISLELAIRKCRKVLNRANSWKKKPSN